MTDPIITPAAALALAKEGWNIPDCNIVSLDFVHDLCAAVESLVAQLAERDAAVSGPHSIYESGVSAMQGDVSASEWKARAQKLEAQLTKTAAVLKLACEMLTHEQRSSIVYDPSIGDSRLWRVGNHQPQNIYLESRYVGVAFDASDAAHIVARLNCKVAESTPAPPDNRCPERYPTDIGHHRCEFEAGHIERARKESSHRSDGRRWGDEDAVEVGGEFTERLAALESIVPLFRDLFSRMGPDAPPFTPYHKSWVAVDEALQALTDQIAARTAPNPALQNNE